MSPFKNFKLQYRLNNEFTRNKSPDYVAKINDDNKFPIKKFGALAQYLLNSGIVKNFHIPKECSIDTLKTHSRIYQSYQKQTLDIRLQKNWFQ